MILSSRESVKYEIWFDEKPNSVSLFGNKSLSLYHNPKQNGHQQAKSGVDRIATHGIVKKTQKTPLKEIAKAEEIRKEYFNDKKK